MRIFDNILVYIMFEKKKAIEQATPMHLISERTRLKTISLARNQVKILVVKFTLSLYSLFSLLPCSRFMKAAIFLFIFPIDFDLP